METQQIGSSPSERDMLPIIEELFENNKTKDADNLAVLTTRKSRITYALCLKTLAYVRSKTDRQSATACCRAAMDLLSLEDPVEREIIVSIQKIVSFI